MDSLKKFCLTWGSSQYNSIGNLPLFTFENTALRQIVRISLKGEKFRFTFSNYLGEKPLILNSVRVALSAEPGSGKIISSTNTKITFGGQDFVEIPSYGQVTSDEIDFSAPALSELAVTVCIEKAPETITGHVGSRTYSFIDKDFDSNKEEFTHENKLTHWYFLSGIEVLCENQEEALVCFGDSITDGRGSTDDKQNRWTDILATRLQNKAETAHIGVINQGIGGTCLTTTGVERFNRDVLSQNGIKYLIILYGVNDILFINASAQKIISVYKNMIQEAHKNNIRVFGGTILPFGKNSGWSEEKEKVRQTVNEWIMNCKNSTESDTFDDYIDFAAVMKSAQNEIDLNSNWNFEMDGLHPNAQGYKAMGEAVPLNLFFR